MGVRLSLSVMKKTAAALGGKCLSRAYRGTEVRLRWRCSEGHTWLAMPKSIRGGSWCPECARQRRVRDGGHTIAEMRSLAMARGGKCLSGEYVNLVTKLRWRCSEGHEWETRPSVVLAGHWCPVCSPGGQPPRPSPPGEERSRGAKDGRLKLGLADLREMARERGGTCLSTEYLGYKAKHKWRCAKGHVWETSLDPIQKGSWCPACAGFPRYTISDMRRLARKRGGRCLSERYVNSGTKLGWRCRRGHEWEAVPASIVKGTWCPRCAKVGRPKLKKK